MLNIKIRSNYKSIVEEIIEEINKEFKEYNIYEGSMETHIPNTMVINESSHYGNRHDNNKLLDLINNKRMSERVGMMGDNFSFNESDEYYYAFISFSRDLIDSLNKIKEIEHVLIERELSKFGIKIIRLKSTKLFIFCLKKEYIK